MASCHREIFVIGPEAKVASRTLARLVLNVIKPKLSEAAAREAGERSELV